VPYNDGWRGVFASGSNAVALGRAKTYRLADKPIALAHKTHTCVVQTGRYSLLRLQGEAWRAHETTPTYVGAASR
jgi:hypothetical protein